MSRINRKLVPLKLLLFFLYAAIGCLPAFLTVHMFHIGLSHEEVTLINTLLPIVALGGPPCVGYLADRFGHYRLITISAMFLAGLFHTALLFVPERGKLLAPRMQVECHSGGAALLLHSCDLPSTVVDSQICPQIPYDLQINFQVENCHYVCDKQSQCTSSATPSPEIMTKIHSLPHICIPDSTLDNNLTCHKFGMKTAMSVISTLTEGSSSEGCCRYEVQREMVCPQDQGTLSGCSVVCDAVEKGNSSQPAILQQAECLPSSAPPPGLTFWLYLGVRSVAEMFPAVLISLFDAVVLTMVAQHGGDYGRQKMFGLFAIGTSAPVVGYLMDKGGGGVYGRYVYAPVFYVFDGLLLITAAIMLTLPLKVEVQRTSMLKNLKQLIRTSEFNVLVGIVIVLGAFYGYMETFVYVYLLQDLGASSLLLGFTITVGIVPSLPFLYKSEAITNYCGHHYLLILAFVGYSVRFAGLAYLKQALWVIPLEILELFTINLMQVAAATLAYKLAPKTLVATAQGLVWISHFDIGRAIGTIVGGYMIQIYGMVRVFEGASVISAICAIIYLIAYQLFKWKSGRAPPRLTPPDRSPLTGPVPQTTPQEEERSKENGGGTLSNGNYIPLASNKC